MTVTCAPCRERGREREVCGKEQLVKFCHTQRKEGLPGGSAECEISER